MNVLRRVAVLVHVRVLEFLLFLSILLLIGQLSWPAVVRWWHLPRPATTGIDQFESETLAKDFLINLPQSYRSGQTWPLVVFLHGSGDRGNDIADLQALKPFQLKLPAIVAAPQCLPSCSWEPQAVARFIENLASRYSVDRDRIYLVGYSMGGYGTWRTAATYPELFAAIVPICGGGEPENASTLAGIPVWTFHGAEDKVVPVAQTEGMVDSIRNAGGQPQLTILHHAGHGICDDVCGRADLWKWLLEQHRSR